MAEFERSIIKERQAEGIVRATARGVYKGRVKVLTDAQVAQARQWVADGIPKAEVARRLGIGRATLCKYLGGDSEVTVKGESSESPALPASTLAPVLKGLCGVTSIRAPTL
ncbi:recombinase family protein [Corynebacterium suicordis]